MTRPWPALITLSCLLAATATGCSTASYLLQAGAGQLALYNRERKLTDVINDPHTSEKIRERLVWVPEIKKFVEAELGVPATSNYTTYVQLDRPYVDWSLSAAEAYELKQVTWSFPFFGAFPYLGFFKETTANEWADDYRARGYDTYVRGVAAYSTLGYLRDPLLSSMLSRDKADMVNLLFHETTHGQLYIHSFVEFNEQLASYIGDAGERLYLEKSHGSNSPEMNQWRGERDDRRRFGALLRAFADELKALYAANAGASADERARDKTARFEAFRKKLETEPWHGRGFARAGARITNNAALLAMLTYEDDQPVFELLDEKCGGRPADALRYLKSFEKDWDRLRASSHSGPDLKPQDLLKRRLASTSSGADDARRGVCLYLDRD